MRRARIQTPTGPREGEYRDGVVVTEGGEYVAGEDGPLLPPCEPTALYCVGRNYAATLDQMEYERPEEPDFFIKPPTSVVAHGAPVVYPDFTEELTYAGELVAVVDDECHGFSVEEAPEHIRGYTIMNDVDALDQQGRTARKAFDGSAPLGPWLETDLDPRSLEMHTDVSGERRQEANTELMLFGPYEVVSYLSKRFTLRPGDAIAFGSPANPGTVDPGDVVEITYEGVGTLRNEVVAGEA